MTDAEVVEEDHIGFVGYGHYNVDLMEGVIQLGCLEVDDRFLGIVKDWLPGTGCNTGISKCAMKRCFRREIHQENRRLGNTQWERYRCSREGRHGSTPESLVP